MINLLKFVNFCNKSYNLIFLIRLSWKIKLLLESKLYMTNSNIYKVEQASQDLEIWSNLRFAIAKSSGFKRWQQEQDINEQSDLDLMVRRYLKETLETLAY